LDHPDASLSTEALKLFRNLRQIASSITLESKTCKWDDARAVIAYRNRWKRWRGDRAKDLYDTAQLEEKQFKKPHATRLYRQIVKRISRLAFANQARTRLAELEKAR
jgi:hypothetical protein